MFFCSHYYRNILENKVNQLSDRPHILYICGGDRTTRAVWVTSGSADPGAVVCD